VQIVRRVDVAALAAVDAKTLAEADEAGYLAGNGMFQDLSGCSWEEARTAVAGERDLITRLEAAGDLEAEAQAIEDERLAAFDDPDTLWNLDVGVIGAAIVLSALGAAPVASCNAGGFGGHHQASHPYVAFYLPVSLAAEVLALAEAARVGLAVDSDGLARLYADRDLGPPKFSELAVAGREGTR
jgi:hypothetical protein